MALISIHEISDETDVTLDANGREYVKARYKYDARSNRMVANPRTSELRRVSGRKDGKVLAMAVRLGVGVAKIMSVPDDCIMLGPNDLARLETIKMAKPAYITGNWTHIFEGDKGDRATRIVIDAEARKLLKLEVLANRAHLNSYRPATRIEFEDVEDSLLNANPELFDDPAGFGLEATAEMPAWAV